MSDPSVGPAPPVVGVARKLIVGNWKMNGLGEDVAGVLRVAEALRRRGRPPIPRVAMCAPATLIERLARALVGSDIDVGGQDLHPDAAGAHTGDVSAAMLRDAGAQVVIVGHSERRLAYGETDALVARKAEAALAVGLTPIICVGKSEEARNSGTAVDIVTRQALASIPPT